MSEQCDGRAVPGGGVSGGGRSWRVAMDFVPSAPGPSAGPCEVQVRIAGALDGAFLAELFEVESHRDLTFDLSSVTHADAASVGILSRREGSRCRLIGCPGWLLEWIVRERRPQGRVASTAERRR